MKPPGHKTVPAMAERPSIEPLVAVLEVVASEQPENLPWLVSVMEHSPARFTLAQLAEEWQVPLQELRDTAARAATYLDRLESRPIRWNRLDFLRKPHLVALARFATLRRERVRKALRRRRLEAIGRRLERCLEAERRRRWIDGFLGGDAGAEKRAMDRRWIEEFIAQ